MAATRAFCHVVCEEAAEAAAWAERAARAPGAHVLIALIAAAAHTLNGDRERASLWAANARSRRPAITAADFFRSFPFTDDEARRRLVHALGSLGF